MAETILFSELGVSPDGFVLNADVPLSLIGEGFNSRVVSTGDHVIKVGKTNLDPEQAIGLVSMMQAEELVMAERIGDNMPPTMYLVVDSSSEKGKARVVTVQQPVGGLCLKEYLEHPESNPQLLLGFLYRSLDIYLNRKLIPDLANVETGFNIFLSRNVLIDPYGNNAHKPFLVDTNFGKTQRSRLLGPIWTRLIAGGVKRGIAKLEANIY